MTHASIVGLAEIEEGGDDMNVNHIHASSILYRIKRDLNHLIIRLDNLPQTPARKALMDAIARACVEAINTTASDLIASTDTEGGN